MKSLALRVASETQVVIGGLPFGLESDSKGPPPESAIQHCVKFIETFGTPLKSMCRTATSYGHKHRVERWLRDVIRQPDYIPNGAFIVAALRLGYRAEQHEPGSPNAVFNMRLRASSPRQRPHRRGF